jgi:hypothetical protein
VLQTTGRGEQRGRRTREELHLLAFLVLSLSRHLGPSNLTPTCQESLLPPILGSGSRILTRASSTVRPSWRAVNCAAPTHKKARWAKSPGNGTKPFSPPIFPPAALAVLTPRSPGAEQQSLALISQTPLVSPLSLLSGSSLSTSLALSYLSAISSLQPTNNCLPLRIHRASRQAQSGRWKAFAQAPQSGLCWALSPRPQPGSATDLISTPTQVILALGQLMSGLDPQPTAIQVKRLLQTVRQGKPQAEDGLTLLPPTLDESLFISRPLLFPQHRHELSQWANGLN